MHFAFVVVIEISHGVTDFTDILFSEIVNNILEKAPVVML